MVEIEKVQEIIREASKLFLDRNAASQAREKGMCDFVTAVDEAVQAFIQHKLYARYPDIQFIGEEKDNTAIDMAGAVWVLDPVDGTTNLIHDYHASAISLALMENREAVMGVIYDPYLDEMYHAEKGKGSFMNGSPIHVSRVQAMRESLIAIGTAPYFKEMADENFALFAKIFRDCQDIRRCGAASLDLAHVACGRIDGYLESHLKIWDYAAGALIVREAGGAVLNYQGDELPMAMSGSVVVGNPKIAGVLVEDYLNVQTGYNGGHSQLSQCVPNFR